MIVPATVLSSVGEKPPALDSHERMLQKLKEIERQTADNHPFLGSRALREAQANLDRALGTPTFDAAQLSSLHGALGEELLRAGETERAILHTQKALDNLPAGGDAASREIRKYALFRLAIANLRLGENANCVACANGESCLLPIQGEGVHDDPQGSQAAVKHLLEVLAIDPSDLKARWLLNIAHMTLGTWPAGVPEQFRFGEDAFTNEIQGVKPFRNVATELGLDTRNLAGSVILDDFDGDDYIDIVRSTWDTSGQLLFFRNRRDGSFAEESDARGLTGILGGLNLIQADYDNDGDTDILVLRGAWLEREGMHPMSLLQNDGQGRFRDVTYDVGLADVSYPTQTAAWIDFDNDGDLDLFVGNEGFPCQLFENDGRGKFVDIAAAAGVNHVGGTKAVLAADFDGDRWPDLYISNLPGENRLFRNNGDKTFTDVAREMGVTGPHYSFPCWFWDYNNDGVLDLYVASFTPDAALVAADYLGRPPIAEGDCFYRGVAGKRFVEESAKLGFTRVTTPMGSNFGDIDNDGYLDFYLGTGYVDYDGLIPNLLFRNAEGKRFDDATFAARVGHLQKGHGVAFADLDNDGDQDLFAQMGGWFTGDAAANCLFENPGATSSAAFISVKLIGQQSNRSAIGARIKVVVSDADQSANPNEERAIYRWVNSGGTFGANPLRQHIGIGNAKEVKRLEIYWPTSDLTQTFENVPAGARLEIREGQAEFRTIVLDTLKFISEEP